MLEDFKLSFDLKKLTVKIESECAIGVIALYRKIREWEASETGIIFPDVVKGVDRVTLQGGSQTAVLVIFINGWQIEASGQVNLVGGLVAGRNKEGNPCDPIHESSRKNVHLISSDREFIPSEAQIVYAQSQGETFAEDWVVNPIKREIRRKPDASDRIHTVFALYWFLKISWRNSTELMKFDLPLEGDNRLPVPGLDLRWDFSPSWTIPESDLRFLVGGPLVHRNQVLVPPLSEEEREQVKPEAEAAARREAVTIGVITALNEEFASVLAQLDDVIEHVNRRGKVYFLGRIPARNGGVHEVALTIAGMGNNFAATTATALLCEFPSISELVMVGIAGAVPHPEKAENHVRLGDIVVCGQHGVVQYDHVKDKGSELEPRHPPRPPSRRFLNVVDLIQADHLRGERPWNQHLDRCGAVCEIKRPSANSDRLAKTDNPDEYHEHPEDSQRNVDEPRIFVGTIGAANVLLKNPARRDEIRDKFGIRAVEMESSGIADAAYELNVGFFVVRGTCDYCDGNKNDEWHHYAAAIASAFFAALLRKTPKILPRAS